MRSSRQCGVCLEDKPLTEFNWRRKALNQRDNMCRDCRAEYKRAHYRANRQRYISNSAARTRRVTEERTRFVVEYLSCHSCVDCGETDVLVLEFDHLRDKMFNISAAIRGYRSMAALVAEIQKCDVVCCNCHRRRTARRGSFSRVVLTVMDADLATGRRRVAAVKRLSTLTAKRQARAWPEAGIN